MSTLYVVATPIGNLEDLTLRARRVLGETPVLACEDTRVTRKLFDRHDIRWPETVVAYHEHNEDRAGARLLALLDENRDVAFCTDAGYPSISDPGWRLIDAALASPHTLTVLPGAGAVEVALLLSGLPTSSFTFRGFPPRKSGKRQNFLREGMDLPHTLILYESPRRVGALLADAYAVLGNRRAAVCLELTKKFERVHRGALHALATDFAEQKVKGEAVVVIAGNHPKFIEVDVE